MTQTQVDLNTDAGILDVHLVRPDGVEPRPAVVFYMDAFGIRPELMTMAARLAAKGYLVAVPNLYYRSGAFPPLDPVEVAAGGLERDRFKAMIASIDNGMVMRDTAVLLSYLATDAAVRPGPIGVVGYCMGGGYALAAAGTFPDRIAAAAIYHAGSLATAKPDSAHLLADQIRARVYIGVAAIDPSFPDEQRQRLEDALRSAAVDYTLDVYEGARHGFAVTGHLAYDANASERHWATLVDLFDHTLQPGGFR